jgi:hypothetical protein
MGFSKKNVQQEIAVAFTVRVENEQLQVEDQVDVVHVFKRPTIKERELYRQMAHSFQGGKPQLRLTKANLKLWDACIVRVQGYDDLPEGDFKPYFLTDDIGKEHADAAVRILLDRISEAETELEKNSDE